MVANNLYNAPKFKGKSYVELKMAVEELLFPIKGKKEGLILTIVNLLRRGQLGYAAIGENRERASQIEAEFSARVI